MKRDMYSLRNRKLPFHFYHGRDVIENRYFGTYHVLRRSDVDRRNPARGSRAAAAGLTEEQGNSDDDVNDDTIGAFHTTRDSAPNPPLHAGAENVCEVQSADTTVGQVSRCFTTIFYLQAREVVSRLNRAQWGLRLFFQGTG